MTAVKSAYINALLADASYIAVTPSLSATDIANATKARLTEPQAAYLAANFTVADSYLSPVGGFDTVVWQIKAGSGLAGPNNPNAGKVFVSMRGTQGGQDIADDITLAARGVFYDQVADMVNWSLKSTAAVTNTQVKQITVPVAPGLIGAKTFALASQTKTGADSIALRINSALATCSKRLSNRAKTSLKRCLNSKQHPGQSTASINTAWLATESVVINASTAHGRRV